MTRLSGHLAVIAVGKLKEPHWRQAQADYLQRLGRFTAVQLIEVKDAVGKGMADEAAMQKEGDLLLQAAHGYQRHIVLSPDGALMESERFAQFLQKQVELYGRIAFLIGGPLGFSPAVTTASHNQIALSSMTFTHEIARIILLEQLYRACTILAGVSYHK